MNIAPVGIHAFDVEPIIKELDAHPEVWNEIKLRTEPPTSPHREVDDIWIRYNPLSNYQGDMSAFNGPHVGEWYPVVDKLPSVKLLCEALQELLQASEIGAVLITRVPPGKQVYPHVDGGWHAATFEKFCIQVKGNKDQAFCFDGEELRAEPGDVYWFDNSKSHWVINQSDSERISLIVCLRR